MTHGDEDPDPSSLDGTDTDPAEASKRFLNEVASENTMRSAPAWRWRTHLSGADSVVAAVGRA